MAALLVTTALAPALLAVIVRLAGRGSGPLAAAASLLALAPAAALLILAASGQSGEVQTDWLPAAELEVGLRLDGLSAVMSVLVGVAGVAALIHSRGYFFADARAPQAQAGLLAFLAAMQGLVLADNFLTLLIFWELVGALSARLIAYERGDPRARPGAIRAFLTTRSADAGLYIAIAALHAGAGTLAFEATRPEGALGIAVGLGLVVAAAGKSAQLPFQTWLSGAMAGPTPVSALLHSATMVAAGVYLLVRAQELLAGWPLELAAWLGAVTAVVAAVFALAQRDLKLVLASSTTSQLGLMFVAAGAGVPGAAIFHLIAHAAGKAGMFLAAGVFHRRRGTTSLDELAGVGRRDRPAFWGFAACAGSIAAVPPLAAFWSKDTVLRAAEHEPTWFVLAAAASVGTAAYLLRPALILWRGAPASDRRPAGRPWMLAGVALLVAGSALLGAVAGPLAGVLGEEVPGPGALTIAVSIAALAAGAGIVLSGLSPGAGAAALAERQLATNDVLRSAVERPMLGLAGVAASADAAVDSGAGATGRATLGFSRANAWLERHSIGRGVDAIARGALAVARGNDWLERRGVDAQIDGLARAVARGGGELPRLQTGHLYRYLRNTVAGIAFLVALFAIVAIA